MTRYSTLLRAMRLLPIAVFAACSSSRDAAPAEDSTRRDSAAMAPAVTPPVVDSAATAGSMLDPNTATREQLLAIPGMTAAAADALVAGRPYADMLAVDRVLAKQLGAAGRATVYARLWKPIDLNTAKGEEIVLIPGVGARMRHEFEEYRPYKSMDQFRREIGKYVKKAELARLEQYVRIP